MPRPKVIKYYLVGQVFERLTVIEDRGINKHGSTQWLCRCVCGNERIIESSSLVKGKSRSCGCLQREAIKAKALPYGTSAFNKRVDSYKRAARERCLSWELSIEEVRSLFSQNCSYCGHPPSNVAGGGSKGHQYNGVFVYSGIDRVDNSKGYLSSNVVPSCKMCNRAKSRKSYEVFTNWLSKISRYAKGRHTDIGLTIGIVSQPILQVVLSSERSNLFCQCNNAQEISAFSNLLTSYKKGADARGFEWELSEDIFCNLVQQNCHYCGSKPSRIIKYPNKRHIHFAASGIDRVNNKKGYIKGNVVPACSNCNFSKHGHLYEDFMAWIKRVSNYRYPPTASFPCTTNPIKNVYKTYSYSSGSCAVL